ncbi:malto-oligosyltrehalose trehalohydrolase [Lacipirellula parvula]|uniref:Malto-oligosyltrehalose trehalohydrolase n=1 Tax=Lacipirellula parvula TaxID=2650471 RepID=A0A5K7XNM6_9BACT|nr:malto-oligosyltrehalose trehalohydrolase [Lacipirellula parvula]BBO36473.1 malto-oligosyltrehalose trehalohydrolase [Lacipirellula parvula]
MSTITATPRKLPAGAETTKRGVHFRLWAPRHQKVELVLFEPDGQTVRRVSLMEPETDGYYTLFDAEARAGDLYGYRIDGHQRAFPDPASRYQPLGVHSPSQVVDAREYKWNDAAWPGVKLPGQVMYELHVGTFTPEGTWAAAIEKLPHLKDVGVTLIEVMPINDFHGDYGWGYDGVAWFAPTRLYGSPDDCRRFVDEAHRLGIGVILDVVYNHFGANGNYTGIFSTSYFSKRHPTEWGDAINYDGEQAQPVRDFVTSNAAYWIDEFHFDGLRIDATQAIYDDSSRHLLADISVAARKAAGKRSILLIAENELQQVNHVEPTDAGGYGLDGLWNDDFHHTCRVAATGHAEFYYADYAGSPQEILSAIRHGYLYQGQFNPRQKKRRGSPTRNCEAAQMVHFLQNHDQVANSGRALRLNSLTSAGRYRALTAVLLLAPPTPLLFMGQEFGATTPFSYFADHDVDLKQIVRDGRWGYIRNFPRTAKWGDHGELADPSSRETFEQSKLDWDECRRHEGMLRLHRDLLQLRREDPIFSQQDWKMLDGAIVGPEAFILRWFAPDENDRLLCVNLGRDMDWRPVPEPLAAPPRGQDWRLLWSSEQFDYAGAGTADFNARDWIISGHTAIVLEAVPFVE